MHCTIYCAARTDGRPHPATHKPYALYCHRNQSAPVPPPDGRGAYMSSHLHLQLTLLVVLSRSFHAPPSSNLQTPSLPSWTQELKLCGLCEIYRRDNEVFEEPPSD